MDDAYSIVYSSEALNDLKEIYSYIAFTLLASSAAEGQVNRRRKAIRSLTSMPFRNPISDHPLPS